MPQNHNAFGWSIQIMLHIFTESISLKQRQVRTLSIAPTYRIGKSILIIKYLI